MATIKKNMKGYGYKYSDLSQINKYCEENNIQYWQYLALEEGYEVVYTVIIEDGQEKPPRRGCRVIPAELSNKSNAVQEYGAALTYARRYSLLLALGIACEDDDAECLTRPSAAQKGTAAASSRPAGTKYTQKGNVRTYEPGKQLMPQPGTDDYRRMFNSIASYGAQLQRPVTIEEMERKYIIPNEDRATVLEDLKRTFNLEELNQ